MLSGERNNVQCEADLFPGGIGARTPLRARASVPTLLDLPIVLSFNRSRVMAMAQGVRTFTNCFDSPRWVRQPVKLPIVFRVPNQQTNAWARAGIGTPGLAGLLCERLILHGYSLCVIDPEGDRRIRPDRTEAVRWNVRNDQGW